MKILIFVDLYIDANFSQLYAPIENPQLYKPSTRNPLICDSSLVKCAFRVRFMQREDSATKRKVVLILYASYSFVVLCDGFSL